MVSVIMNCRNGERYLREAINSVYAQTFTDFEIIFWDNLSTDSSPHIAQEYDSRLQYYRSTESLTLGEARNQAMKKACGKYIAFLDCDDIWFPDKVSRQVEILEQDPHVSFIYSNYIRMNTDLDKYEIGFHKKMHTGYIASKILFSYPIAMVTIMVRRDRLLEMDEIFDPHVDFHEEYELFMRFLIHNRAEYIHQPLAMYRFHSGSMTHSFKRTGEMKYIADKWRDGELIAPGDLAKAYVKVATLAAREREWSVMIHAFFDAGRAVIT